MNVGLRRVREAVLAVTFLAMAGYETAEALILEAPHRTAPAVGIAVHALQVGVILAATWVVLRALRARDAYQDTLARMVEKVVFAQESERQRIAYELHDGLSPLIVGARMHIETGRDVQATDPARATQELTRGIDRLDQAIVETRHILRALRPGAVDADGLATAVRRSLDEAAASAGWTVRYEEDLGDARLPAAVETAAFRIVQEALTNAARHARTRTITVSLHRTAAWLALAVQDQGHGFQWDTGDARNARGLGLASMRERAHLLGGECTVESAPGQGTAIRVRLPLQPVVTP